ncbi:MAG TPA: tetratricopeptide repeat protein [Chthoniobacterales bacterium]
MHSLLWTFVPQWPPAASPARPRRLRRYTYLLAIGLACSTHPHERAGAEEPAAETPAPTVAPSPAATPALPKEARDAAEKGLADFRAEQFEEARQEFSRMIELAPNHPMGWANLGAVEYRLNALNEAEEDLKKAVHLDPAAASAWLTLGIIYYQKSDLDGSLAALSQAVYLEPNVARNHLYLGVLVRKKGWLDAAGDELRRAVELDENYAEAHFNLAILYLEQKPAAVELARRHYFRALKLGAQSDPDLDRALRPAPANPGVPNN